MARAADTTNTLQAIDFAGLPGNKARITLTLSNPAPAPLSFTIDNPARIALDFPATSNALQQRSQAIGIGMAESLTAIEAQGRTRVVINLTETALSALTGWNRLLEIVPHDPEKRAASRDKFRAYRAQGLDPRKHDIN